MKNRFTLITMIFLLLGCVSLTGCTGPELAGAMAQIAYGGLTGDEQGAAIFGQQVQAAAEEDQQRQFLLSQLPAEWKCEGAELYQDDSGRYIYARPDNTWYCWEGGKWKEGE